MSAFELVELEPLPGRRLTIEGELTIGRHECDLTISSPQVSRRHATIAPVAGGVEITDLSSRNGTFVNDGRIAGPQALAAGDTVQIGETIWEVVVLDSAAPTELAARGDVPAPPPSGVHEFPPAAPAPGPAVEPAPPAPAPAAAPPPSPPPRDIPELIPTVAPPATPLPAEAVEMLGPDQRPRASAARRMEATLICYAVVVLTAIAVVFYLATR